MITEDYVSFEVAKLLKEKGFDGDTASCYILEDSTHHIMSDKVIQGEYYESQDSNEHGHLIQAPTLQMAMKWLREVHKIYIDISPTYSEVEKIIHFIWQIFDSNYDDIGDCEIFYGKYETACEAAIKYCLENLI